MLKTLPLLLPPETVPGEKKQGVAVPAKQDEDRVSPITQQQPRHIVFDQWEELLEASQVEMPSTLAMAIWSLRKARSSSDFPAQHQQCRTEQCTTCPGEEGGGPWQI